MRYVHLLVLLTLMHHRLLSTYVIWDDRIAGKYGCFFVSLMYIRTYTHCFTFRSYAQEWNNIQQELEEAGIGGPTYVSIGDSEKLNTFLEANPWMAKEQMYVDDYAFNAYKAVGFQRFDQADKEVVKSVDMGKYSAPKLGFGEWMTYLSNVAKVSPIPPDMKFGEVPEGVLWTGGTFVILGSQVVYQWTDTVPGNHPDVSQVVDIAKDAAKKKNTNNLFSGWF